MQNLQKVLIFWKCFLFPLELPVCLGRQHLSLVPFPCEMWGLLNDCFAIYLTVEKEKIHFLRGMAATWAAESCGSVWGKNKHLRKHYKDGEDRKEHSSYFQSHTRSQFSLSMPWVYGAAHTSHSFSKYHTISKDGESAGGIEQPCFALLRDWLV